MLRQFHYIDQNGKDQGVNVRNRSKELTELLSDVDRIRAERKKARANRNKFGGVEGGAMSHGMSGGGSRYGGFGSETGGYGAYSGGVYGDGGGFGGNTSEFQDSSRRDRFEEYDEYDEGAVASSARRKPDTSSPAVRRETAKSELPIQKEPEIDILSFDADDLPPKTPPKDFAANGKKTFTNPLDDDFNSPQPGRVNDDDDFDDFQTATPNPQPTSNPSISGLSLPPKPSSSTISATQIAAPKPVSGSQGANLSDLVDFNSISPAPSTTSTITNPTTSSVASPRSANTLSSPPPRTVQQQPSKPTGYQAAMPNYYTSVQVQPSPAAGSAQPGSAKPSLTSTPSFGTAAKPTASKPSSGGDAFGALWSSASASAGLKKASTPTNAGPNLASMAKEKTSQGIWGAPAASTSTAPAAQQRPQQSSSSGGGQRIGGGLDDLLG